MTREADKVREQIAKARVIPLDGDQPAPHGPNGVSPLRTPIELRGGELHLYADKAQQLLREDVFVRGRKLVRIGAAPELVSSLHGGLERRNDQRVIVPVSAEWLRLRLTARAKFQHWDQRARKLVSVDCPAHLSTNIASSGEWPHFRPLDSIATSPFLRVNQSICETSGYDALSRVFYAPSQDFPKVPQRPLREDALQALNVLLAPFYEFPFATPHAKAALVSHILTAVARHALDLSPAFLYTAPLAGTGKTLLASMPSLIAQGVPPAMRPYVDESEELRKVLFSALLAGDSGLLLDNVPSGTKIRSPTLCAFVTSEVYSDRRLGTNDSPQLPNRCICTLTGNNLTPSGDFARRSIIVRLDENSESVRGRDFKIADLKAHIAELRPQLLIAALTILRAHTLAAPPAERPLPSFEKWSRIARDPLHWLGCADPVLTQGDEADDELEPLREAFGRLAICKDLRAAAFTAREITVAVSQVGDEAGRLREAIEAAGCTDATTVLKVGYWLRENRDRVAGRWKLKRAGEAHKTARWALECVGSGA
jgi:hypothetical protein